MNLVSLDLLNKYEIGVIRLIDETKLPKKTSLRSGDLEARLLEMGFIEGAIVKVMHVGYLGHGPIAVRINNNSSLIALRTNEARTIFLEKMVN